MADSSSYRTSRGGQLPPRRDGPSSDPARDAVSDPLAELARLIGQDEAFGAIVRNSARPEPQREPDPPPPPWRNRSDQASRQTRHEEPVVQDSKGYAYGEAASAPATYEPHAYDAHVAEDAHAHQAVAQPAGHYEHDAGGEYYDEGAEAEEGHYEGEEDYADPVPRRRRGILVMAAAVVGLGLVGTAGAFGYWAWSTGPRGEPPLIKADTTPNKVVPATQGEAAGNKSIYDRASASGGNSERVVSREEAPAEIKSAPPRSVYPAAGGVYGPAPTQPAAAPPQAAAPPSSGVSPNGAPRVVHTETIRPSQVAVADIGQPVAPPLTAAATPPGPPPAPVAAAPAKQPAPRTKQAAQSPAAQPTETPPARDAAPTGGYVVQLSSQKTEEEARASFKVLASKYASVFGDREPYIKRVSIPEKGTFYRANVGPFATSAEANHFCSNLKIVGGQCLVQKN
jgi:cytoskeletal protein RodZ